MPVEIRQRAFFSAAVEETRLLQRMQRDILTRLRLERRVLADGTQGTFQRRDQFVREMQALAERYGLRPTDGRRGTLEDIGSFRRLRLIWDVQTKMAQGYSRWLTENSEVALDRAPVYELVRKEARRVPRDWNGIWRDAIQALGDSTRAIITPNGRMMAPKGDPIWIFISRFNQPWEPFDFNSGMGLRQVRRRVAERFGVIEPGEKIEPQTEPFNVGLEASLRGVSTPGRQKLKDYFGDLAQVDDERVVIEWKGERLEKVINKAERRVNGETFDWKHKALSFGKADGPIITKANGIMDLEGYELKVAEDDVFHILRNHGPDGERRADQRPVTIEDFWYLLTSWRRPVRVEAGNKRRALEATYNFLGELVTVFWNIHPNQKIINLNTMFAKK